MLPVRVHDPRFNAHDTPRGLLLGKGGKGWGRNGEMTRRVWLLDNPRLDKSHVRQIPPSAKPCRKIQNGVLIIRARYGLQPVDTI